MERVKFRKAIAFAAAFLLTAVSVCGTGTDLQQEASLTASAANQTETFSITKESCAGFQGTMTGYGNTNFYVFTTERDKTTGNIGTLRTDYKTDDSGIISEKVFRDKEEITFPIEPDAHVYMWVSGSGSNHSLLHEYDTETSKMNPQYFPMQVPVTLSKEMFPEGVGCSKVKVYGRGIKKDSDSSILGKEIGSGLEYTAEEFAVGKAEFLYTTETPLKTDEDFTNLCQVIFEFEDGSKVEYVVIGNDAYINEDTRPAAPLTDENGDPKKDSNGNELVKGSDENGNPVVSDETLKSPSVNVNSDVVIYEGANEIDKLTYAEYKKGKYVIRNYDPEKNYYVRVSLDSSSGGKRNGVYYKYDKKLGTWIERVNTEETPQYNLPISFFTFPKEMADGDIADVTKTVLNWGKEDFCKSLSFTMDTVRCSDYLISFHGDDDSQSKYKLIGIDPELVEGTPTAEGEMSSIPFEIPPLTSGTLHGETEAGDIVEFEFESPDKSADDKTDGDDFFLFLPDGDYHVESENGLYDNFTVDEDRSEGKEGSIGEGAVLPDGGTDLPNLKTPEDVSHYKITDPNGSLVDEDELDDGVLDSIDDLNLTEDELRGKGKYFYYETEVGVKNSTDPDALKKESGCFTVTEDGTLKKETLSSNLKGDVNIDGEVTVADVIMLQKYLLKAQTFTLGNYVNADTCVEGDVNVFDLAMLKRIVVNQNKENTKE